MKQYIASRNYLLIVVVVGLVVIWSAQAQERAHATVQLGPDCEFNGGSGPENLSPDELISIIQGAAGSSIVQQATITRTDELKAQFAERREYLEGSPKGLSQKEIETRKLESMDEFLKKGIADFRERCKYRAIDAIAIHAKDPSSKARKALEDVSSQTKDKLLKFYIDDVLAK
ncbi:hypothetical protein [Candidatus Nitronereus thalassa]|uniref:Uncharacterized protein n=1 Tax=Candidatus Nitronereus thalassa TaxID=3020898 RepID=A0ABU3K998_9BACT|nr:hypothetical protein [Candidatus Nitronereus thalassa]MDT7043030.1 hypothetical protein [Candidatus Nitronereus thalassa]